MQDNYMTKRNTQLSLSLRAQPKIELKFNVNIPSIQDLCISYFHFNKRLYQRIKLRN